VAIRLGGGGRSSGDYHPDEGSGDIVAEINITPLTDVFLVLLIIFMVTSSVMSNSGVDVNLPQASNATAQAQPEGVIVTLLPTGEIQVNDSKIAKGKYDDLESSLKGYFAKTTSRLVILEGDRQAFLGNAIEVMDHARKAGAEKFAIATAPEK
jgi:biopolymer transport protein ExbD